MNWRIRKPAKLPALSGWVKPEKELLILPFESEIVENIKDYLWIVDWMFFFSLVAAPMFSIFFCLKPRRKKR
jgi:hypothetical protein